MSYCARLIKSKRSIHSIIRDRTNNDIIIMTIISFFTICHHKIKPLIIGRIKHFNP